MSLVELALEREGGKEGGRRGEEGREQRKAPIKQLHKRRLLPLLQGCIRLPSYQVDKRRKN